MTSRMMVRTGVLAARRATALAAAAAWHPHARLASGSAGGKRVGLLPREIDYEYVVDINSITVVGACRLNYP